MFFLVLPKDDFLSILTCGDIHPNALDHFCAWVEEVYKLFYMSYLSYSICLSYWSDQSYLSDLHQQKTIFSPFWLAETFIQMLWITFVHGWKRYISCLRCLTSLTCLSYLTCPTSLAFAASRRFSLHYDLRRHFCAWVEEVKKTSR